MGDLRPRQGQCRQEEPIGEVTIMEGFPENQRAEPWVVLSLVCGAVESVLALGTRWEDLDYSFLKEEEEHTQRPEVRE